MLGVFKGNLKTHNSSSIIVWKVGSLATYGKVTVSCVP